MVHDWRLHRRSAVARYAQGVCTAVHAALAGFVLLSTDGPLADLAVGWDLRRVDRDLSLVCRMDSQVVRQPLPYI